MESDLQKLNVEIALRETNGDKLYFDTLLAPTFSFRRANGAFDDRQIFLASLTPNGAQRECDGNSVTITPLGKTRAFVTCLVRMKDGDRWLEFHNARLFVKTGGSWRLLAWANEPAGDAPGPS